MPDDRPAFDAQFLAGAAQHTEADVIEIGERLYGTKIPNCRVVLALMTMALSISGRDEASRDAYRGMLYFLAERALDDTPVDGDSPHG